MSATQTTTGENGTQQRKRGAKPPIKAGAKRNRRTKEQLAAARLAAAARQPAVAEPVALAAIKPATVRLATMVQWFGEASESERRTNLACLNAMYPALPKAA